MRSAATILALSIAAQACQDDGPLTEDERRSLGGSIYFISGSEDAARVHRVRPDGTSAPIAIEHKSFPQGASPDGSLIALITSDGISDEIAIARPDGSAPKRIAPSPELDWYPRFSPDGTWILFESARSSFRDLYKVSIDGGEPVRLTDDRQGNFDGDWSPDGARIAFASSRHGQLDLFVMNADGSGQRRLTHHPGDSIKPAWSPKGDLIAFISGRDERDDLFVIRPDGSKSENLTKGFTAKDDTGQVFTAQVESFDWSPDGRRIAYGARVPGRPSRVYVVEVATGAIDVLSGSEHADFEPSWSPDGRFLAFASSVEGRAGIWLMRANGQSRTKLIETPEGAWLPRWLRVN